MNSKEIRKNFLDFFKVKEHLIVASAPIVLKNDPTLMFNNSGMAQFKEYFLGNATPKSKRIADTQKCLRVSGKHNDLEDVGFDTYHHTMFEMLGNWSFGDYFKKEAIHWAWELLTEVYQIPKENLYVSVFEGNEAENVPFDQEAFDIWKSLIEEDRIIFGNKKDNFWEMGDQGPCGPCSEIHVDLRTEEEKKQVSGKLLVNNDHPQVVEIWNNVFMEFNRKADGSLEKLPAQHVDTGMGFERLCMALQGKTSNYDTDVFMPLIQKLKQITALNYTENEEKNISEAQNKINIAIRVVVDHVRAVAFAIADGQLPSNTGAGYVIRRILRRAIRYGFTFLGCKEPFIYQLVEVLAKQMGDFFPEIKSQQILVTQVIKEEEVSFLRTLEQGLQMLDKVILDSKTKEISGVKVFELKDTFGFPEDLTDLILREKGYSYNVEEFKIELEKQRERGKVIVEREDWTVLIDNNIETFVGYDVTENEVKISRIRKIKNDKGVFYQLVLNNTPFYPEGGGQVGDKGVLISANESIEILDTKKENNLIIHITKQLPENINADFVAKVTTNLRNASAKNHSATHLMHLALRTVLGTHVEQKGSLVNPDYLRFDFSHFSKVSDIELQQVEDFVNERIDKQIALIERRNIPIQQALDEGAMALFGEKYGDTVRAIKFDDSMELCGGIHVKNTLEIGQFKIISEGAVASGIRRIEAITGNGVKNYYQQKENNLQIINDLLKNPQDTIKAVSNLQEENIKLKKQLESLLKEKAKNLSKELASKFQTLNEIEFLAQKVDLTSESAKGIAFELIENQNNRLILLATIQEDKPMLTCAISKELVAEKQLNASNIVRELGKYIQGGGGGQPFFATAGGKNKEGINEALSKLIEFIT